MEQDLRPAVLSPAAPAAQVVPALSVIPERTAAALLFMAVAVAVEGRAAALVALVLLLLRMAPRVAQVERTAMAPARQRSATAFLCLAAREGWVAQRAAVALASAAAVAERAAMAPSSQGAAPAPTSQRLPAGPAAQAASVGLVFQAMVAPAASEFSLLLQVLPSQTLALSKEEMEALEGPRSQEVQPAKPVRAGPASLALALPS